MTGNRSSAGSGRLVDDIDGPPVQLQGFPLVGALRDEAGSHGITRPTEGDSDDGAAAAEVTRQNASTSAALARPNVSFSSVGVVGTNGIVNDFVEWKWRMSPRTPTRCAKSTVTPPPRSHARLLFDNETTSARLNSTCVFISPSPPSRYGCTGPSAGTIMMFDISVMTLDDCVPTLPKKFFASANSSSNPSIAPMLPIATPRFVRLSSQPLIWGQPELPPKSYPMSGLMKPCACDGVAANRRRKEPIRMTVRA